MARVILQPFASKDAQKHYESTIKNPVTIERLAKYLPKHYVSELTRLVFPAQSIPTWGVKPGDYNTKAWGKIKSGDIALFYRNKTFLVSAVVISKIQNLDLAANLWGYNSGQTWEYLYFLSELKNQQISLEEFNRITNYNYPSIQGFRVLDEERSTNLLGHFNLSSKTVLQFQEDDAKYVLENAPDEEDLTLPEQKQLRLHKVVERDSGTARKVKKRLGYICMACGFDFEKIYGLIGRSYIEAHHLKPYSELKEGESRDLNIDKDFAVLCANCHRMIHRKDAPKMLTDFSRIIKIK